MPMDHKQAQKDRELALAKLKDASEENETSEVVARAVEGGVRGALASIREGDDTDPPPTEKPVRNIKKIVTLVIAVLSALGSIGAALSQFLGK